MKRYTIALVSMLLCLCAAAQNTKDGYVVGRVYSSSENQPMQNATLQLYSLPDTVYVAGTASDKNGEFRLKATKGNYLLRISYVGFMSQDRSISLQSGATVDLGRLNLSDDAIALRGAVVTSEATPITMVEDTTVYNTSAFRVPPGSMLEELIKKYPGAQIAEDGTITINGKTVNRILMKGKDFYGTDKDLALKNVPADLVDKVKFYDKQSDYSRITGIDDGEEETVLDLQMKKGADQGFFGNIDAAYGTRERYSFKNMSNLFSSESQLSLLLSANNINNRGFSGSGGGGLTSHKDAAFNFAMEKGNVELGGNVRYRHSDSDNLSFTSAEYFMTQGRSNQFSNSRNKGLGRSSRVNADFRLEWKPDTLTNIIFRPSFSFSESDNWSRALSATFDSDPFALLDYPSDSFGYVYGELEEIAVNSSNNESLSYAQNKNFNASLQVNRRLGKPGRNITLRGDFKYGESWNRSASNSSARYYADELDDRGYNYKRYSTTPGESWSYNTRVSYTEPLTSKLFLQVSYRFDHSYNSSDRSTYRFDSVSNDMYRLLAGYNYDFPSLPQDYELYIDDDLSKHSVYRNIKHDVQLMLRYVTQKVNLSAGVTWMPQSSRMSYRYHGIDTVLKRSVYNIAPNLRLRYKWNKTTTLNVMYRGTTSMPSMTNLLDITDDSNPLDITKGNPGLKPSFNNRLMAFFNTSNPETQTAITANLMFNTIFNSITNKVTYIEETGARITQPVNINGNWGTSGGFNYNSALPQNKKFTYSTSTNLSFQHQESYISLQRNSNSERNSIETINAGERLKFGYRNDIVDVTIDGALNYSHSDSKLQPDTRLDTWNFSYGPSGNVRLPWHNLTLSTNLSMSSRRGFDDPQFNTNELLWNAQLSASFLKGNSLTVSLQLYDILHEQSNISRSISAIMRSDSQSNAIYQYGLIHVIYKINSMGGSEMRKKGMQGPKGGPSGGFGGGTRGMYRMY